MRKFVALVLLLLSVNLVSQELNCKVYINSDEIAFIEQQRCEVASLQFIK